MAEKKRRRARDQAPSTAPAPAPDVVPLAALTPDPRNRRAHPERNLAMIADALKTVGVGRSLVLDEANEVLAGNGVLQAAPLAGIDRVRIIDVEGDTLVALRRRGLTDEQKRALALFDNRTGELAEWNVDQLRADRADGLDLSTFFSEKEIAALLKLVDAPDAFRTVDENVETSHTCPKCGYEWSGNG